MEIKIFLTSGRIEDYPILWQRPGGVGAWVEFRGIVRAEEGGKAIGALEYEAYSPMAEEQMHRILAELAKSQPCLCAHVVHRIGIIPAGEAAIYAGIGAAHRAEAFALMTAFLDQLKKDVPIWKCRALAAEELKALS